MIKFMNLPPTSSHAGWRETSNVSLTVPGRRRQRQAITRTCWCGRKAWSWPGESIELHRLFRVKKNSDSFPGLVDAPGDCTSVILSGQQGR